MLLVGIDRFQNTLLKVRLFWVWLVYTCTLLSCLSVCVLRVHAVIRLVVTEMMDRNELASTPSFLSQDVLTVFQFYSYATKHNVTNMEEHLLEVAREGMNTQTIARAMLGIYQPLSITVIKSVCGSTE